MGRVDFDQPVRLKDTLEYVRLDPGNQGGPRYGHLAELDPAFAAAKPAIDAANAGLWQIADFAAFRKAWQSDAPLPAGCPRPGVDVRETYRTIPVRDGAAVELKIMTSVHTAGADNVCVLHLHGGGWATGGHGTEHPENLETANRPGVVLVSVDYRLAPEHRFPVPLHDCFDALLWAKAHAAELGVDPEKIVLQGGSAGSNLSLALALMAREKKVTGIRAMILDWPTGSHPLFFQKLRDEQGFELESYVQNHDASVCNAAVMEFFLDCYIPDPQPDPYHSPLLADSFAGLPPALLQIAGADPLRDEGLAVAEKLKKDGVPTEVYTYKGLPHFFSLVLPHLPQSKQFVARQNAYLDKIVEKTKTPS